ncbi:Neuroblastoma breakpoint family member 11, partial [Plecturocebus cupreus]
MVSVASIRESIKSREYPECEKYKDVIDSVLRDAVQLTEEQLAEQCRQAEELREVQKVEEKEVPEDSVEERAVPCSHSDGPSDSIQPLSSAKVTFEEDNVDSALIVDNESSPDKWEDTVNILP